MRKWVCLLMVLAGACGVWAQSQVELMEANPWDSNMTHQVVWETTPGVRYELQESGSLATNWATLSGYPRRAERGSTLKRGLRTGKKRYVVQPLGCPVERWRHAEAFRFFKTR